MVHDALDAVDVVTFDYPCELIQYFSLLLVTLGSCIKICQQELSGGMAR